ncbi:P-loop containing nucleoside triphosphate hydrolase protein [Fomitopsis serialis]|uniref:P-loop containing nucleoside triphosphate hydrolase protein n=1 Tax=Fomitopsis serialis TaxID=139415 RepID=UPI00200830D3|nr:P-loop containing nucleoside triphosphate hydrolase protein [Neoantrodia serialis]KAH9930039.1 P-loop containing nucleoside triphosphate hydrolase protein [Neoantrodia serialis]
MSQAYFRDLNPAQVQAVQHPPDVPLQILAGPGSGKTRVLTARIAHLIFHHHVAPQAICAVTFTNKAANEMRARLDVLVGTDEWSAWKPILRYAMRMRGSMIAKAKARGQTADDVKSIYLRNKAKGSRRRTRVPPDDDSDGDPDEGENQTLQDANIMAVVADVYTKYEHTLRQSNSLDFDDLLLFGVRLFARHPAVGDWCQHVLVDEFQDTNTIQYKLMRRIAAASGCVTIVGDPDQSIYGWRSAEVKNFMKMQRDFPKTQQILLEQNYRSTASILSASMAIVSQESALQKEGIPNRVLGGHKFFERLEVKDLLAYLQLIDNPHFVPAFARVINVPARGIGEKTIAEILATAQPLKLSPLEVVMRIYDGTLPDIKPSVKRKLASFVPPVRMLQKLAQARTLPSDLIRNLIEGIEYEAYLRKMQKDWDSRWENVQELINFASEVETKLGDGEAAADLRSNHGMTSGTCSRNSIGISWTTRGSWRDTPLRLFLQASMLSTDMTADNKDDGKGASNGLSCLFLQALLYLTHANSRMFAGEAKKKDMSDFVSAALWANQVWNASHGFPNRPAAHPPPGSNIPAPFQGPVQFSSARTALSDKPLSSGGLSTPKALPLPPLSPIRNTVVNTAYNHLPTAPRHPVVPEKAKRASDTTSQHANHRPTVVKPSLTKSPLHAKPVPTETSQSASPPQSLPATLPSSGSDEYRSSTVKPAAARGAWPWRMCCGILPVHLTYLLSVLCFFTAATTQPAGMPSPIKSKKARPSKSKMEEAKAAEQEPPPASPTAVGSLYTAPMAPEDDTPDSLWEEVRRLKEKSLAKSPPKSGYAKAAQTPEKKLTKRTSSPTFKESPDGLTVILEASHARTSWK